MKLVAVDIVELDGLAGSDVPRTEAWEMEISLPPSLLKYLVNKGSVGVEGVSLTVTEVKEESFGVVLIDFTLKNTTFS